MRKGITFVDGDRMGNTVTGIHHDTSGTTGSVQGKDCLDCDVHSRNIEGFKHDLRHTFAVSLWIQRCLSEQNWVFLRGNAQLVIEGMVPNLLHVVPVGNDTMLDR